MLFEAIVVTSVMLNLLLTSVMLIIIRDMEANVCQFKGGES